MTGASSVPCLQNQARLPLHLIRQLLALESERGLFLERDVSLPLEDVDEKSPVLNMPLALLDILHEAFELGSKILIHN